MVIKGTEAPAGATPRRCPDISKMRALGFDPRVDLMTGLARTADWYRTHRGLNMENLLL
jgi:UDP-glucose 4-epimerase